MMMDDCAQTHKRRKLVKTYKIVLPRNRLWLLKYIWGDLLKKMTKIWSRKTATDVKIPRKIMGNAG